MYGAPRILKDFVNPHPQYPPKSTPGSAAAGSTPPQTPHARSADKKESRVLRQAPSWRASVDIAPTAARNADSKQFCCRGRERHRSGSRWLVSCCPCGNCETPNIAAIHSLIKTSVARLFFQISAPITFGITTLGRDFRVMHEPNSAVATGSIDAESKYLCQ
jgi:hypothetical protein